jgi:hypothetical protein
VQLLTEEVDLLGQEDICALELAQVEALSSELIRARHHRVDMSLDIFTEFGAMIDNRIQRLFLFWLEWQVG